MYKTAKPENFESRWEYTKATSSWHFDKFKDEDREPPFKILGRFKEGAWQNEFDEILKNAKTTPVTFRTRLASGAEPYTMRLDDNDLAKMGLATSHALYSKLQLPSTAFWLGKMARFFQLSDPTVAFHIQYPGQVFPFHIDNLTGIRSNQHGHPVNFDPESVIRFEIQLKDWEWGHMWAYGNTYWKQWKAGEIAYHKWMDIPHGTANAGHIPRCLMQITGYLSDFTRELIKNNNLIIDLAKS